MQPNNQIKKAVVIAGILGIALAAPVAAVSASSGCATWIPIAASLFPIVLVGLTAYFGRKAQRNLNQLLAAVDSHVKSFLFNEPETDPANSIKSLETHLKKSTEFIRKIGAGDFSAEYNNVTQDLQRMNAETLSGELLRMKTRMMEVAEQEKQRAWVANGIAHFSEIVRAQNKQPEEIYSTYIGELVKYIGANQGGIFIAEGEDPGTAILELKASYAYGRRKYVSKTVEAGCGLVGQAYLEGDYIFLKDVPANYVTITSGLGEATPRCVMVMPMKNHTKVEGIIEVASFRVWEKFEIDFLKRGAEILGSAVSNMKVTERTKILLQESQLKSEQLKSREEELRQNLEEMHATQETIERTSREAVAQNNKLNAILDSTPDTILTTDETGGVLSINRAGLKLFGYTEADILGRPVKMFFTSEGKSGRQQHYETLIQGLDKMTGQRNMEMDAIKKDNTIFPVELAVNAADTGTHKIFTIILRDISERVRLANDQLQYIEELRAQEEELKQNMEELQATQDEIQRQMEKTTFLNRELDARVAALNTSTIMSESDLYGGILYINEKFCEVSQYTKEELIGKPHNLVRHPDMPKEVFKLMWSTIKAGKVFRGIVKNRKKDGTHYWVDAVISPVLDDDGKPVKYIGVRYVIENEALAQELYNNQLKALKLDGKPVVIMNNEADSEPKRKSA